MSLDRFRSVDIRIDKADHYFMSSQFAKGGDYNGRTLVVQITNGGLIETQAGITVNLGWRHESVKNSGLDPFEVVDAAQGIFEISYPREMLNPGRVTAVIQIIDGETITETKNFVIQVEKSPIDETSIVSSNSFTVLQEALIKVNSWNARIDAVEADFIERANNLDATYPIELNSVKRQLEHTNAQVDLLNRGLGETFATLVALQTAYPTGDTKDHIVGADGHRYYWSGSAWADGGAYQAVELIDGGVQPNNLSDDYDLLKRTDTTKQNGRMTGYDTGTLLPIINTDATYQTYKMIIPGDSGQMKYYLNPALTGILGIMFVDGTNKRRFSFSVSSLLANTTGETWVSYASNEVTINLTGLATRVSTWVAADRPTHIYISAYAADSNWTNVTDVFNIFELGWTTKVTKDDLNPTIKEDLNTAELVLPSAVPLVVGRQLNLYYENILYNSMLDGVGKVMTQQTDVGGKFYTDVWQVNPNYETLTTKQCNVRLHANDLTNITQTKSFNLKVVPKNAVSGNKKVMIIGDSKVNAGTIPSELVNLFSADGYMTADFIGSRGTAPALHEGRPGWSAKYYCTVASFNNSANIFWNPTTSKFDFSYGMTQLAQATVDVVCINLGTNDAVNDSNYENSIAYYNEMIASIKLFNPNVKILIGLPENMSQTKFVFTINKNRILGFVKRLITEYDNRTGENIHLIPLYLNINLYLDYTFTDSAESDRNPSTIKRCSDETHQNTYGYLKNADMIYSAIKYAFI